MLTDVIVVDSDSEADIKGPIITVTPPTSPPSGFRRSLSPLTSPPGAHHAPSPSLSSSSAQAVAAALSDPGSAKPVSKVKQEKPKSKKARTPSPPPAPVQLDTVRLTLRLGGPENYEVDVAKLARETGQRLRAPTPPAAARDGESSGSDSDEDKPPAAAGPTAGIVVKKPRKRNHGLEQYDLHDDFIDDTELAIDERKFFAQTKQTGFYVSSGEVALLKDPSAKPKSTRSPRKSGAAAAQEPPIALALVPPPKLKPRAKGALAQSLLPLPGGSGEMRTSACMDAALREAEMTPLPDGPPLGSQEQPIALGDSDGEEEEERKPTPAPEGGRGTKRKASLSMPGEVEAGDGDMVADGRKRRKLVALHGFHPVLERELELLRGAVQRDQAAFAVRGKFPVHIKPLVARVAMKAVLLDDYDDAFFAAMPGIFPYNRFTMTKLIKRLVYQAHTDVLVGRSAELLADLQQLGKDGFENAKMEHERALQAWDNKQERKKAERADGDAPPPPAPVPVPTPEPPRDASEGADGAAADGGSKEDKPPQQKYKLTEAMRSILWSLVSLSNESVSLKNEKNKLENVTEVLSEQGMRKVLYQKACFPDGWMTTGILSREVSSLKKRHGREAMENLTPEP